VLQRQAACRQNCQDPLAAEFGSPSLDGSRQNGSKLPVSGAPQVWESGDQSPHSKRCSAFVLDRFHCLPLE